METYVGKILERAVRRQEISISELCRKLNISRRTLYNWFERQTLNPVIVSNVGRVIGHDFAKELGDDFNRDNHQAFNGYLKYPQLSENYVSTQEEEHYWMQKYIQLLEDYNQLLQKVAV